MFSNAQNFVISGGQFTTNVVTKPDPFELLRRQVSTSAFHNSAQRVDPPRCHENTRLAVLEKVFSWITQDVIARKWWILWLNGPAGAGKTAIAQSIAELCVSRGLLVASFFLFRADPTRNNITPIVATIAYQLLELIPGTKDVILSTLESNPLIFEQSFKNQLDKLVVLPLLHVRDQFIDFNFNLLLIIDGVDECNGQNIQVEMIRTVSQVLNAKDLPITVIFSSRAENHLKMIFNAAKKTTSVSFSVMGLLRSSKRIPSAISLTARGLQPLVEDVVQKSSGQFIYSSVVMKFVSLPNSHPPQQLEIICGLRPSASATPFAQLDALYRHILSCVQDKQRTTSLLAFIVLAQNTVEWVALFFDLTAPDVHVALAGLASVITCEGTLIRILHSSLPDFLLDASRSHEYHINASTWGTALAIQWFQNVSAGRIPDFNYSADILHLLGYATCTEDPRHAVLAFVPHVILHTEFLADYLAVIKRLDFGDGGKVYHQQLDTVIRYVRKERPNDPFLYMGNEDDIAQILDKVEHEKNTAQGEDSMHPSVVLYISGSPLHDVNGLTDMQAAEVAESGLQKKGWEGERRAKTPAASEPSLRSRIKARLHRWK